MNRSTITRTLARGIRSFVVAVLLAGWAMALQPAMSAVQAGPPYQPPTNNVYVIHAGAYVDINTPIGAIPGADDADSGAVNCTLRDALGIVNAGTTGGTVNGCTITAVGAPAANIYRINLSTGGYTYTLNGSELLTSANTVYIVGDTAANTIIQANANSGVATYRVLRNNGATVEMSRVSVRHGQCEGACAGVGGFGGGILNQAGTLTLDGSTVSANTATRGGGIWNWATLNVVNGSTVSANTATGNGGGICNDDGTTTVDGSTVSANTATGGGGGISNMATLNVVNGSTIGGAGAGNQAVEGGGICNWARTTTVDGSTVSANTATNNGGGIYNLWGITTVTGSRILNNTATANGGGVYSDINAAGATNVTGSCIVGNSATSFLNNQTAQQIATGNWWGAATGPNTPGADTVVGNVDTSGFLTAPILGCPANYPDLRVLKANDTGGSGTVDMAFNWTLTVANIGGVDATFNAGQGILEDDLPAGPTYGVPAPGNFANITNTVNISCAIASNTLTCDAAGGSVTIGATTGRFDVVFSVTPNAVGLLSNPSGNCQVDPNDNVAESNEGNNNCPADNVNVAPAPRPPEKEGPPPPPTPIPPPQAREFNCWPWLVIVPPGAARNVAPGEWCQASLGQPLPAPSTFRYLGHSTEVTIKDAAGKPVTQFVPPLKVCFHYTQPELDAVGGDPASLLIQVLRDGTWEALDTKPDSSLRYPGVCAPVNHLTLFALFARNGAAPHASVAASDSKLLFPSHLPETGERLFGSGGWGLAVAGVAILAVVAGAWLLRRR